jgi:hypothetical protein
MLLWVSELLREAFGVSLSACSRFLEDESHQSSSHVWRSVAGKFAPTTGLADCLPCPLGRANAATGQDRCQACLSGKPRALCELALLSRLRILLIVVLCLILFLRCIVR